MYPCPYEIIILKKRSYGMSALKMEMIAMQDGESKAWCRNQMSWED